MGLDVSHDAWSGSYGSFTLWRNELCNAMGIGFTYVDRQRHRQWNLDHGIDEAKAFDVGGPGGMAHDIDWSALEMDHYMGEWDRLPRRITGQKEPLLLIITHSDCDGRIKRKFLYKLAQRLEEIAELMPENDHGRDWKATTLKFALGCYEAYSLDEDLLFR